MVQLIQAALAATMYIIQAVFALRSKLAHLQRLGIVVINNRAMAQVLSGAHQEQADIVNHHRVLRVRQLRSRAAIQKVNAGMLVATGATHIVQAVRARQRAVMVHVKQAKLQIHARLIVVQLALLIMILYAATTAEHTATNVGHKQQGLL